MRKRGKVQRTHICTKTAKNAFENNQKKPVTLPQMVPGAPLVQSARRSEPMFGKGVFQLPQNKIAPKNDTNSMMAYSDKNNNAQRIPEYSV